MYKIIQPSKIIFGIDSAKNYAYPTKCLVITSQGTKNRDWLNYLGLEKYDIFDMVEPNPSMETVDKILTKFDFDPRSPKIDIPEISGSLYEKKKRNYKNPSRKLST